MLAVCRLASVALLMSIAAAAIATGCADDEPTGPQVTLRVTRDFGRELIAEERLPLAGHGTPVRLLEESHDVQVNGFGRVDAIDGLAHTWGSSNPATQTIWSVHVNGIESDMAPARLPIVAGDVVQFDLGDADGSFDARGSVGSFPQPFKGGIVGLRPPVRVRCVEGYARACQAVTDALRAAGVDVSGRPPAQPRVSPRVRRAREFQFVVRRASIEVGPWRAIRDRRWPRRVSGGPHGSGVFASFGPDGRSMRLLDWNGRPRRTLGAGAGLIAAMRPTEFDIVWLVTGVDREGVQRAVRMLRRGVPRAAFAVAITGDDVEKLPVSDR
jgi:hypothetical protein